MNPPGKIRALFATARVANVPSVLSNLLCGMVIALVTGDLTYQIVELTGILHLAIAGICLYVSGNFLNDWFDRDWDAARRPERALPRGLFHPATYLTVGIVLAAAGILLASLVSRASAIIAVIILALVALYTRIHKRTPWSVVPMGLCRALLPWLGASGLVQWHASAWTVLLPATALFAYIAALSLAARFESSNAVPPALRKLSRSLFLAPPALAIPALADQGWLLLSAGLIPYFLWITGCDLLRLMKLSRFVPLLLAGIPFVDWLFLLPIGLAMPSDPLGIACLAIPPLAVAAALLLQKAAPAT